MLEILINKIVVNIKRYIKTIYIFKNTLKKELDKHLTLFFYI